MYPGAHAAKHPDKAAVIMAGTGEVITFAELDQQASRIAGLLRTAGLQIGDHVAFCLENHPQFLPLTWGCHYAGLIYTAMSSRLTTDEMEYIVDNCGAKAFITSAYKREQAKGAAGDLLAGARELQGIRVVAAEYDGDLKEQADRLRDQLGTNGVVILGRGAEGSAQLVVSVTADLAGKRVHAGKVIQAIAPLVGGKGGGKPEMAQGGGKEPAGLPAALEAGFANVEAQLGQ